MSAIKGDRAWRQVDQEIKNLKTKLANSAGKAQAWRYLYDARLHSIRVQRAHIKFLEQKIADATGELSKGGRFPVGNALLILGRSAPIYREPQSEGTRPVVAEQALDIINAGEAVDWENEPLRMPAESKSIRAKASENEVAR